MRPTKVSSLALAAIALVFAPDANVPAARGATLVQYDLASGGTPSQSDPRVVASPFGYDSEILGTEKDVFIGNPPPSLGSVTPYTTIDDARRYQDAFATTLTPAAGYAFSLES